VVDAHLMWCYNYYMDKAPTPKKRKRRNDCRHVVYCLENSLTGEQYIGITVASGNVNTALKIRVQKHVRRALTENKTWALCKAIREHGAENFVYWIMETVRGRLAAHARERELISTFGPALNTR